MQLIIPMSGRGNRFREVGYKVPKPIIPINGRSVIERLLGRFPKTQKTHFILSQDDEKTALPEALRKLRPEGEITFIAPHKLGPGHALEHILHKIDPAESIIVSYCDYDIGLDFEDFERFVNTTECDACLISYRGFHAHYLNPQTYAYSRLEGERVVEVKEKGSFTNDRENEYASCGAYYFKSVQVLKNSLLAQKELGLFLNGESYTSLTIEAFLRLNNKAHVRVYEIPQFFQFGTPQDLETYAFWERSYQAASKLSGLHPDFLPRVEQVLIPMAGLGSRFKSITDIPKPFIPIRERTMVYHATKSLPLPEKIVWVTLKSVEEKARKESQYIPNIELVILAESPQGQALSTMAGIESLDKKKEVMISSCDHGIVLNPKIWKDFREMKNVDAAIFTVKNFPGTRRTPKAFAYVDVASNDKIARINKISVKQVISDDPFQDRVLVGTFWISSGEILEKFIQKLIKLDLRVNNELYLDSAFELMVKEGLNVVNIPLDGYQGWGDPDSLAEAMYWEEIFNGRKINRRPKFPGLSNV